MVDYQGLVITIALCTVLAAVGALIDKFMLPREKNRLTEVLVGWWLRVEGLNPQDAPASLARGLLSLERKLFGAKIISFGWILRTLIVSVILTALALLLGQYLFYLEIEEAVSSLLKKPRMSLVLLLNYIFDVCTIAFTMLVMGLVIRWKVQSFRVALLTADAIVALLLALSVYTFTGSVEFWESGTRFIGSTGVQIEYLKMDVRGFFSFFEMAGVFDWESSFAQYLQSIGGEWFGPHHNIGLRGWREGNASLFTTAITTLIPTILWLLALIFVTCSMVTFSLGRYVLLRLFELDVETDKSVFFYTGALVGFLGVTIKVLFELNKLVFLAPQL